MKYKLLENFALFGFKRIFWGNWKINVCQELDMKIHLSFDQDLGLKERYRDVYGTSF